MQDNLATIRLWTTSDSDEQESRGPLSPRVRTALWHAIGAMLLAVAMMAQSVATAVQYPARTATRVSTETSTPASHQALTSSALPAAGAPAQSQYFASTGKSVAGDFLGTFQKFGLSRIGYPISGEQQENGTTVQYFERVRMERHPELASKGYGVLFSRLGAQMTQGAQFARVAPFASTRTNAYVPQPAHSLAEPFLSYWKNNGGVDLFGYPISEAVMQDGLKVQWFERARFEYHAELARTGQPVQLTLLGSLAYEKSGTSVQQVKTDSVPAKAAAAAPAAPPAQIKLNGNE